MYLPWTAWENCVWWMGVAAGEVELLLVVGGFGAETELSEIYVYIETGGENRPGKLNRLRCAKKRTMVMVS